MKRYLETDRERESRGLGFFFLKKKKVTEGEEERVLCFFKMAVLGEGG